MMTGAIPYDILLFILIHKEFDCKDRLLPLCNQGFFASQGLWKSDF